MNDEVQRDLGRHEAEIGALQSDMVELKRDVKSILTTLSEARGGWKTLMLVAGIAGAVGAVLGKVAMAIGWIPK